MKQKYSEYVKEAMKGAEAVSTALITQLYLGVVAGAITEDDAEKRYRGYVNEQVDIIMTTANLLVDAHVLERDVEHIIL